MATYQESKLLREVTRLGQELVSLKSPQRYLTGQTKGYESNKVRATSRVAFTQDGYEWREIFVELTVIGDHTNKTLVPTLRIQLYNSSGYPIPYGAGQWNDKVGLLSAVDWATTSPNEHKFSVLLYIVGSQGTTDAFYGDFWAVANDSSIIKITATRSSNP